MCIIYNDRKGSVYIMPLISDALQHSIVVFQVKDLMRDNTIKSFNLTHKVRKCMGGILSTVATFAKVLKHQGIITHRADQISIALESF